MTDITAELQLKHRCALDRSHTFTRDWTHPHENTPHPKAGAVISVFTQGVREPGYLWEKALREMKKAKRALLNGAHLIISSITHGGVRRCSMMRTDRANGDGDREAKQRSEIWRREETESQNKRGGSKRMEDRMKMTDNKTTRTREESFPFLGVNIQKSVRGEKKRCGHHDSGEL